MPECSSAAKEDANHYMGPALQLVASAAAGNPCCQSLTCLQAKNGLCGGVDDAGPENEA